MLSSKPAGQQIRARTVLLSLVAMLSGAGALIVPFTEEGVTWQWRLHSETDLAGATINAALVSIDDRGAVLLPQGERAISLITPGLTLEAQTARQMVIELGVPEAAELPKSPALVRLLWQTAPAEGFKFAESEVRLSREPTHAVFSLPESPELVHRLGVQVAGWQGPVVIRGMELANLPAASRASVFMKQLREREPIRSHSLNFVRGPVMLGRGMNYYLVALVALAAGGYGLGCAARRNAIDWRVPAGIAIGGWLLGDVQATTNLVRNVREEVRLFGGRPHDEQIALSEGSDIAWAYKRLRVYCPEGGTFAVASDDPFSPAHRLDYLLAPLRRRVDLISGEPEFVVVIGSSDLRPDLEQGTCNWPDGTTRSVSLIERKSEAVYLLKLENRPS